MIGPGSFGHSGRDASPGLADTEQGVGFGYVLDNIVSGAEDPRASSLAAAALAVLA